MIDLLICSLPPGVINRPPAAPAILKACVEQHGFTARTVDLSLDFYIHQCERNFKTYTQHSNILEPMSIFDQTTLEYCAVDQWLKYCIKVIENYNPKFLGLSVFSKFQHRATVLLSQEVRKYFPNLKIIVGGYGLSAGTRESFTGFPIAKNYQGTFGGYLENQQLSDFQIYGEGEDSIVEILENKPISNNIVDLMTVPVPNFDDYHLDEYIWHDNPVLTITGSKGCVRSCTFCNIPSKFGRYRRRSGMHIAKEIIELNRKYGINKFEFTDSLVNGSQKDFYELVEVLAKHNDACTKEHQITWYGQYICRPQSQIIPGLYPLMKRSGALNLIIGAESGSNDVLAAMNKKMTVEDLYNELEQFKQHGLQAQLLLLGGFYNETWPRYLETLELLVKCHPYAASGTITRIAVGFPLIITEGDYLFHQAESLGIVINTTNPLDWRTKEDRSNTWLERVKRKIISQLVLNQMGIAITGNGISEIKTMIRQLKIYEQQLKSSNTQTNTELTEIQSH